MRVCLAAWAWMHACAGGSSFSSSSFLSTSPFLLFSFLFRDAQAEQEYRFNWGKKTPPTVMFASMWGRASCRGVVEPISFSSNWGKKTPPAVMLASMWGRASCRGVVEPGFQFHFSIWGKKTPPTVMVASMWGRASCRGVVEPIFFKLGKEDSTYGRGRFYVG